MDAVVTSPHKCKKCGANRAYSYRHDALYCEQCLVWLEPKCDDPRCIFCRERPEKPRLLK